MNRQTLMTVFGVVGKMQDHLDVVHRIIAEEPWQGDDGKETDRMLNTITVEVDSLCRVLTGLLDKAADRTEMDDQRAEVGK